MHFIVPQWPAPENVRAVQTVRTGGYGLPPGPALTWPGMWVMIPRMWPPIGSCSRRSCHIPPAGWNRCMATVVDAAAAPIGSVPDASFSHGPGSVCVVMTADCLPVLFCARNGSAVAAAHAGWRGLQAGVLEQTLAALAVLPEDVLAWQGRQSARKISKWARRCVPPSW